MSSPSPRDGPWKADASILNKRRILKVSRMPRQANANEIQNRRKIKAKRPTTETTMSQNASEEELNRRRHVKAMKVGTPPRSSAQASRDNYSPSTAPTKSTETRSINEIQMKATVSTKHEDGRWLRGTGLLHLNLNEGTLKLAAKQGDCIVRLKTKEGDGDLTFDYNVTHVQKIEKLTKETNKGICFHVKVKLVDSSSHCLYFIQLANPEKQQQLYAALLHCTQTSRTTLQR